MWQGADQRELVLVLGNTEIGRDFLPTMPDLPLPGLLTKLGPFFTLPTPGPPKWTPDFKRAEASDFLSSYSGPS